MTSPDGRHDRPPHPTADPARTANGPHPLVASIAGGSVLVVAALIVLLDWLDWWTPPQPITLLAFCAAIVGGAILYEGLHFRRAGYLAWVAIALLILAVPATGRAHEEISGEEHTPSFLHDGPGPFHRDHNDNKE